MDSILADAAARRTALTDLGRTLLVEAGAGTGKTALLAGRVAMLLCSGVAPQRIAAITFTEAAAAQLGARIARLVHELLAGQIPVVLREVLPHGLAREQRDRLQHAAGALDHLTSTTIHGFCRQLLTPHPVETGLDPGATVIEPAAAERLFEEQLDAWLRARLGDERGLERGPEVEAATASHEPISEHAPLLRALASRAPEEALALARRVARLLNAHPSARAPRSAPEWPQRAQCFVDVVARFAAWYAGCAVSQSATTTLIEELSRIADTARAVVEKPHCAAAFAAALLHAPPGACKRGERQFKRWPGAARWQAAAKAAGLDERQGRALGTAEAEHYGACAQAYGAWCDALAAAATHRLATELEPVRSACRAALRESGRVDFDALVYRIRDLLRDHARVRDALATRYTCLLVDEFQDTDPVQAEMLWRLTGEGDACAPWYERAIRPGALFLVGDPKQAIYRFRGADIDTYRAARRALVRHDPSAVLTVSTNFRSRSPILGFVNHTFSPVLIESVGQPAFTALQSTRETGRGPCVATLDVVVDTARGGAANPMPTTDALRRAEAAAVAETVCRLIGAQPVWDSALARERPARAGDIALLAPTGTGLWLYEHALSGRGIAVASQAGKGFYHRQEIHDLIAVVRAVADPRDTLALGALLRGPLVGLAEEQIADALEALHRRAGAPQALTVWTDPRVVENAILSQTLHILQHLARIAHRLTPHQLLCEAVERFHVRPVLRDRHPRAPARALGNVDALLEMARGDAGRGLGDFARALWHHWLGAAPCAEARPDSNDDAVGLLTMHAAKGLEWPIVVPVNAVGRPRKASEPIYRRGDDTVHFTMFGLSTRALAQAREAEEQEMHRERVRLWYVAATRARDLLLFPTHRVSPSASWAGPVIYDLQFLPPFVPSPREQAIPCVDDTPADTAQDRATWECEAKAMDGARRRIVWDRPSRHEHVAPVTPSPASALREPCSAPRRPPPLDGIQRGIILHKLMEEVLTGETPDDANALRARAVALLFQLGHYAPASPSAEMAQTVLHTFALPDVSALRRRLVPEVPLHASETRDRSLTLTTGVADAVVVDESGRIEIVVDWKSDPHPTPATVDSYRRQIRHYLRAAGARVGLLVFLTTGQVHSVTVSHDHLDG